MSVNPGFDRRIRLSQFGLGQVNRATSAEPMPGGKATHVAMAARVLGVETSWIGFLGGAIGEQLACELSQLKIDVVPIRTKAATRVNLELIESSGRITEVLEPGVTPEIREREQMLSSIGNLLHGRGKGALVVISGSLQPGVPAEFYAEIIKHVKAAGSKVFLDSSGDALETALAAHSDFVKPNRKEAEAILGKKLNVLDDVVFACKQLVALGACSAAITLGADGLVWLETKSDPVWIAKPPQLQAVSTVGCGDATLAGFAYASLRGWNGEKALRFAAACGAANCMASRPGEIAPKLVRQLIKNIEVSRA